MSMSAQDAIDSTGIGRARARNFTDMADTPLPNGYPGFDAIWQKVWGIGQGILNPQPTVGSVVRVPARKDASLPMATAGVVAIGALLAVVMLRKTPKSRYRRMKAGR